MMFGRKSCGMEVNRNGVAFALISGSAAARRLERVAYRQFAPDTVRVSIREPNIINQQAFVEQVRDGYNSLLNEVTGVFVSLPDAVGKVIMMDMDGRFKSRAEGLDMIRWKLKKSMPLDVGETHLDYQQLGQRQNGDMSLLVALVSRSVIAQYEELITLAGLVPEKVDFTSFNLFRVFDAHLDLQETTALITFFDSTLGVMVFGGGTPEFIRIKDLPGSLGVDSRVFMEINNSLLAFRDKNRERSLQRVYCISPPNIAVDFCDMVADATNVAPLLLETKAAVVPADSAPADQESLFPFTAAIGAALRSS